jgi:hypothetical protein
VARLAPAEYGGDWLAAFVPIGATGWVAVVQEPRAPVLAPVVDLQDRLVWSGVVGTLIACLVVAGCWGVIVGLLSERRPWFLMRRHGTSPTAATTLTATARTSDSV